MGWERPAEAIREAIELHAFDREKARLTSAGNLKDAGLLRKGRAGEWRTSLSPEQAAMFQDDPRTAEICGN